MNPFVPQPDRDAYATIRGFVYQADLTILRWLDLQPGQALELETGEDIDLVADALNTNPFQLNRLAGRLLAARAGVIGEAFADQLSVMPHLTRAFRPRSAEYRQILLPYIQQCWTARLAQEAFRVSGPAAVRAAFEAACAGPLDQRVRAIFAAVRVGISISGMPDDIQRWLRGE